MVVLLPAFALIYKKQKYNMMCADGKHSTFPSYKT